MVNEEIPPNFSPIKFPTPTGPSASFDNTRNHMSSPVYLMELQIARSSNASHDQHRKGELVSILG
jgi:hypothetical protein